MKRLIGYMLTWTTYSTWLQGDKRGYVKNGAVLPKNNRLESANRELMKNAAVKLNLTQRRLVEEAIIAEDFKKFHTIGALAVCSNHMHLVIKTASESIEQIAHRYKRRTTFALKNSGVDGKIWSAGYDKRFCFTAAELQQKINYVNAHNNHKNMVASPAFLC